MNKVLNLTFLDVVISEEQKLNTDVGCYIQITEG